MGDACLGCLVLSLTRPALTYTSAELPTIVALQQLWGGALAVAIIEWMG